jgi:hypothetical protein
MNPKRRDNEEHETKLNTIALVNEKTPLPNQQAVVYEGAVRDWRSDATGEY